MIYGIIGLILGVIIGIVCLIPKVKVVSVINKQRKEEIRQLESQYNYFNSELPKVKQNYKQLQIREEELSRHIKTTEENVNLIYDKSYEIMQEHLSAAADKLADEYASLQEKYQAEYLDVIKDGSAEIAKSITEKMKELADLKQKLENYRAKVNAAIEAAKREDEKQLNLNKYRLIVSEEDLKEINKLREIAPFFRNSRAVYKIIWESYFRNSANDLVNRILGAGAYSGIYKITNLLDQRVYIGQSNDLADRLKQHIKVGLGLETRSNKLYTAMFATGVENFSFEIIEKCDRAKLNEREVYWINFYKAQEYGYNMSRGGA